MDHSYISDRNIVDLYVLGRLSRQVSQEFESHFIDCVQCMDLVEEAQSVREALKAAGSKAIQQPAVSSRRGPAAWLAGFSPAKQVMVLSVVLLLLVVLPISYLLVRVTRLHHELDRMSLAKVEETSRLLPDRETGPATAQNRQTQNEARSDQETPKPRTSPVDQTDRKKKGADLARLGPQINTPIFVLSSLRKGASEGAAPLNDVAIPVDARLFVVAVELEGESGYKSYSAEMLNEAKVRVWRSDGLHPDKRNAITMTLASDFLRPGNYILSLEGTDQTGKSVPVVECPFRLTLKK